MHTDRYKRIMIHVYLIIPWWAFVIEKVIYIRESKHCVMRLHVWGSQGTCPLTVQKLNELDHVRFLTHQLHLVGQHAK